MKLKDLQHQFQACGCLSGAILAYSGVLGGRGKCEYQLMLPISEEKYEFNITSIKGEL